MNRALPGRSAAVIALLAVLAWAVYWPVRDFHFVFYDDTAYVADNPVVSGGLNGRSVCWAFTSLREGANWIPLTWLSHLLDVSLFGLDAGRHHLTSLVLHTATTLLLFLLLKGMTGAVARSGAVAGLFAAHPLHVESVAWIAERKDVLSGLFWVLTLLAYLRFARRPSGGRYAAALGLFALGLMAKPMLVTVPFLLLLLDWWPLGRWPRAGARRLLAEKLPFLALSTADAAVTVVAQRLGEGLRLHEGHPAPQRIANALLSYARYLGKAAWPADLAVFYPFEPVPAWKWMAALVILAAACLAALALRRREPWLVCGWFWYLGMLVPVIGLVQVGDQALADRYTYLPLIGIFVAAIWGAAARAGHAARGRRAAAAALAGALLVAVLGVVARHQLGFWRYGNSLFARVAQVSPNATWMRFLYEYNAGVEGRQRGDLAGAKAHFLEALRLRPDQAEVHAALGAVALEERDPGEAVGHLREAVRLRPHDAGARNNLGVALSWVGNKGEAITAFREALTIEPGLAAAHLHLADTLAEAGELRAAEGHYREAARLDPADADAPDALGALLLRQGRASEAVGPLERALRLKPRALTRVSLGEAFERMGDPERAAAHYREALRLEFGNAAARRGLGRLSRTAP